LTPIGLHCKEETQRTASTDSVPRASVKNKTARKQNSKKTKLPHPTDAGVLLIFGSAVLHAYGSAVLQFCCFCFFAYLLT